MDEIQDFNSIYNQLDETCQSLIDELRKDVSLTFHKIEEKVYNAQPHCEDGRVVSADIYYHEPLSSSKVVHELLHVKTSMILGNNSCMTQYPPDLFSGALLNDEILTGIVNNTEHYIFYPVYFNTNKYPPEEFYESQEDTNSGVFDYILQSKLKDNKTGAYCIGQVQIFVKLVIQYILYPIDHRFKNQLKALEKLDYSLYYPFREFVMKLQKIGLEPKFKKELQAAYAELRDQIIKWCNKNRIIPF